MQNQVNNWRQEGRIFIWRYAKPNRRTHGWHFTADRRGCASFRDLLGKLRGMEGAYRTWQLEKLPEIAWSGPNLGRPKADGFRRLRIEALATGEVPRLEPEGDLLKLTLTEIGRDELYAAFTSLSIGQGDFGFTPDENGNLPPWMF